MGSKGPLPLGGSRAEPWPCLLNPTAQRSTQGPKRNAKLLLIAGALFCGPALAQTPQDGARSHRATPSVAAPSTAAYDAAIEKMHHDMNIPFTGDADRDFAAAMIPHHQGGVDMAKLELQYGHDPELRKLAQDIVAAQEREIALLRQWQAAHQK